MLRTLTAILALGLLLVPAAQATIISATNGGVVLAAAPPDVTDDAAISLNAAGGYAQNGFNEKQGVLLGAALGVDAGFIPAGVTVNSHMIFLNTLGNANFSHQNVRWTFGEMILGVMSDGGGTLEAASSGLLGAPGTIYPGAFNLRGLEANDGYIAGLNVLAVNMQVTEPGDWIRVITQADRVVPEPASLLLLGTGLAGAVAARRKRNRA